HAFDRGRRRPYRHGAENSGRCPARADGDRGDARGRWARQHREDALALCAVSRAMRVRSAGIDPLTAYLATSPGGMDSVAIIGAASKADLSFVMALQVVGLWSLMLRG